MGNLISTRSDSSQAINTVAFSPDGGSLAAAGDDSTLRVYDLESNTVASHTNPGQRLTKVAYSPFTDQIVLAHHAHKNSTGGVYMVGGPIFSGHTGWVSWADFAPDGQTVASSSLDLTARMWDAGSGQQVQMFVGHAVMPASVATGVWSVRYAPQGNLLATSGSDGTVRLWDVTSGAQQQLIQAAAGVVFAVAFSPAGNLLAAATEGGRIKLFDPGSGNLLRTMNGHTGWVVGVEFSPDGSTIASAGYDGSARLWNAQTGELVDVLNHGDKVHDVAFSPDGQVLATAGDDGSVKEYAI